MIKKYSEYENIVDNNIEDYISSYITEDEIDNYIDNLKYGIILNYDGKPYEIFRRMIIPHRIIKRILIDNFLDPTDRNNIVKIRRYIYKKFNIEQKIKDKLLSFLDYDLYMKDRKILDTIPFVKNEYEWVEDNEGLGLLD